MNQYQDILDLIPQKHPFRFVDELEYVDEEKSVGFYTFKVDEYFLKGHFPKLPIIPGVILLECINQIGFIPITLFKIIQENKINVYDITAIFHEAKVEFCKRVFPGQKVKVVGEKIYFRFGKFKGRAIMYDEFGEIICKSEQTGFLVKYEDLKTK